MNLELLAIINYLDSATDGAFIDKEQIQTILKFLKPKVKCMEKNLVLTNEVIPNKGQCYHVSWARNPEVYGKVKSIDPINRLVFMESPKTHRPWPEPVKWKDLILLNRDKK